MAKGRGKPNRRRPPARPSRPAEATHPCEADVVEGLEDVAAQELAGRFGRHVQGLTRAPGLLRFGYTGDLRLLLRLRTVQTVFLSQHFAVPRPRALLGDEHFRALLAQVEAVRALAPPDSYRLLYLSAAGAETAVMTRLADELAARSGLEVASDEGDLLVRVRRPFGGGEGWEVLVRLSPRPLATRAWRRCNMEGALNATVAHAMGLLTAPTQSDLFLNLACGSGTLLAERLAIGPAARLLGCDTNPAALACARENLEAANALSRGQAGPPPVELYPWDARALPLPEQSVNVLVADLPFGHLVGSHEENVAAYPAILDEAARVAQPGAPFVLITHEVRLTEELLAASRAWQLRQTLRVNLGGLHPRLYVLERARPRR